MKPTLLIIFGFTGDLVNRYLLPALYSLELDQLLPKDLAIMATTRRHIDFDDLKNRLKDRINQTGEAVDDETVERLFSKIEMKDIDITNGDHYQHFQEVVDNHDEEQCKNRLLYFAVPPSIFNKVLQNVVNSGLHKCGDGVTARLLMEKPFGNDSLSAQQLLEYINQHFGTEHLYPIDHYLAKETVQNILYFRFHNPIIRTIWNSKNVSQIQITAIEEIDIQGRVGFYEATGATRDMVQSHLLQLAALATMDEPHEINADTIRHSRQEVLAAFDRLDHQAVTDNFVRAQYEGYRDEVSNPQSCVETFFAGKFTINNDRWRDVPIYIRAGKAMHMKMTEITLIYKNQHSSEADDNVLTIRIQPNEGVAIRLTTKKPGLANDTEQITLDYCYRDDPKGKIHDAYEKILIDALHGDQTLFPTDTEIINNWQLLEPLLDLWRNSNDDLSFYQKGSDNIEEADELLRRDGNKWVSLPNICVPRFLE